MSGGEEIGNKCVNSFLVDREKMVWYYFVLFLRWESFDYVNMLMLKI